MRDPISFAIRIARNKSCDFLARKRRLPPVWSLTCGEPGEDDDTDTLQPESSDRLPSETAGLRELVMKICRLAGKRELQIIQLHFAEGLSFEMVGKRLKMSKANAVRIWTEFAKRIKRELSPDASA